MARPPVIEADELSARDAAIARVVLGPRRAWNPDVALRYLPIARRIREAGLEAQVTDVGSGPVGIAPYLRRPVTGVDAEFIGPPHRLLIPVTASVLATGFDDASRPCVVSVDMLEHLPEGVRGAAVDELVRITGRLLLVACPEGAAAAAHDRWVAERFLAVRGAEHRYLNEHLEHGLPADGDLARLVAASLARHGRAATVRIVPNAPLALRAFLMRRWIDQRPLDKALWVAATWTAGLLAAIETAPAYRRLAVVTFAAAER